MNWSRWIRQTHRWVSIAFMVAVIIVTVLVISGEEEPAERVYLLPLFPLALLAVTGLYLFVLPYATRWRDGRGTG